MVFPALYQKNDIFPKNCDLGRISKFIQESHGVPLTFVWSFSKLLVGKIHISSEFFQFCYFQDLLSCIISTWLSTNSTSVWKKSKRRKRAVRHHRRPEKIPSPIFFQETEKAIFTKLLRRFILKPQRSVDPTFCFALVLIKSSFEILASKRSVLVDFRGSLQCFLMPLDCIKIRIVWFIEKRSQKCLYWSFDTGR